MRRRVVRAVLALLTCLSFYFAAALAGGLILSGPETHDDAKRSHIVHLIAGPIHYDILVPLNADTTRRFAWLGQAGIDLQNPGAQWLVFGWGARAFYTTTGSYLDVNLRAVWKALSGDQSVMHVGLAGALPDPAPVLTLALTKAQFQELMDEIEHSFESGRATEPLSVPGFSQFDLFFPAKGNASAHRRVFSRPPFGPDSRSSMPNPRRRRRHTAWAELREARRPSTSP